jgi:hypothetical protein
MATFNELVFDIMELVRGGQISDDTDLSRRNIAYHLANQRALWLRNEYNKSGRKIDPHLEQDLGCLELEEVDAADCCDITSGCTALRTKKKIPALIELHSGPAITRVGPVNKISKPFSFDPFQKAVYSMHNKYGKKAPVSFLLNDYIYLLIQDPAMQTLDYVNVRGVFANPEDLQDFSCDVTNNSCFSYDDEYPINNWMVPYMKEQILKQLGLSMQMPKDEANDAKEDFTKQ